jgi:hypothetical protein
MFKISRQSYTGEFKREAAKMVLIPNKAQPVSQWG